MIHLPVLTPFLLKLVPGKLAALLILRTTKHLIKTQFPVQNFTMRTNLLVPSFLLSMLLFLSCNKSDSHLPDGNNKAIEEAMIFFKNVVLNQKQGPNGIKNNSPRNMVSKSPQWVDAHIKSTDRISDIVVVPIKFGKKIYHSSKTSNGERLTLENEANLFIYKTKSGFTAEVVTLFPDEESYNPIINGFSGVIVVEDWLGNSIRNFRVHNKVVSQVQFTSNTVHRGLTPETANLGTYCYTRDWYLCSVDEFGNPYDCVFDYTEVLGCFEEIKHDEFEENPGGGGYVETEIASTRTAIFMWEYWKLSAAQGGGSIFADFAVVGKFHRNHPEKDKFIGGYFTGVLNKVLYGTTQFAVNDASVTVNSVTQATAMMDGTFKFANGTNFRATNTIAKQFSQISWPAE